MLRNILDGLEALAALERFGTVSEAATRLRVTQSAVSKRLQALQKAMGFTVVEPDGRRLRITADGSRLLERAGPPMAELRGLAVRSTLTALKEYSLALADSIAASWGPRVVASALSGLGDVRVDLHAHRSVLLIESVRLGRYHIGLCTDAPVSTDLLRFPVIEEKIVMLHAGLGAAPAKEAPLITIEPASATWRAIAPLLQANHPRLLDSRLVPVESFSAALQMVKAGFGNGLCPLGLAIEMNVPKSAYRELRGVKRLVSLVTRKTVPQFESFTRLREGLTRAAERYFG